MISSQPDYFPSINPGAASNNIEEMVGVYRDFGESIKDIFSPILDIDNPNSSEKNSKNCQALAFLVEAHYQLYGSESWKSEIKTLKDRIHKIGSLNEKCWALFQVIITLFRTHLSSKIDQAKTDKDQSTVEKLTNVLKINSAYESFCSAAKESGVNVYYSTIPNNLVPHWFSKVTSA